jgi:hypothetical protein
MATQIERTRGLRNVNEYQRMVETDILTRGDHVELIHGEIVQMTPRASRSAAVDTLHALFVTRLGDRAVVWSQGSLPLSPGSMPEPDLSAGPWTADFYREADIRADDVLLLVEVSVTIGS